MENTSISPQMHKASTRRAAGGTRRPRRVARCSDVEIHPAFERPLNQHDGDVGFHLLGILWEAEFDPTADFRR